MNYPLPCPPPSSPIPPTTTPSWTLREMPATERVSRSDWVIFLKNRFVVFLWYHLAHLLFRVGTVENACPAFRCGNGHYPIVQGCFLYNVIFCPIRRHCGWYGHGNAIAMQTGYDCRWQILSPTIWCHGSPMANSPIAVRTVAIAVISS